MRTVIDASVVIKWIIPEPDREPDVPAALALLDGIRSGQVSPLQPPHWLAEVAAVVSRLRPEIAGRALDFLDAMEMPILADLTTYKRAAELSTDLRHHLFDTLYHAVALESGGTLVSADEPYLHKATRFGGIVHVADWRPVEPIRIR